MVRLIPAGQVLGYGHVAALLGSPRAARQVGYALAALSPDAADPHGEAPVPWWRVIRSDGSIAQAGDPARPLHQRRLSRTRGCPPRASACPWSATSGDPLSATDRLAGGLLVRVAAGGSAGAARAVAAAEDPQQAWRVPGPEPG